MRDIIVVCGSLNFFFGLCDGFERCELIGRFCITYIVLRTFDDIILDNDQFFFVTLLIRCIFSYNFFAVDLYVNKKLYFVIHQ